VLPQARSRLHCRISGGKPVRGRSSQLRISLSGFHGDNRGRFGRWPSRRQPHGKDVGEFCSLTLVTGVTVPAARVLGTMERAFCIHAGLVPRSHNESPPKGLALGLGSVCWKFGHVLPGVSQLEEHFELDGDSISGRVQAP